jgi:hypothetical protein
MRRSGTFNLVAMAHSLLVEHHTAIAELATMVDDGIDLEADDKARAVYDRMHQAFDEFIPNLNQQNTEDLTEVYEGIEFWNLTREEVFSRLNNEFTPRAEVPGTGVSKLPHSTIP